MLKTRKNPHTLPSGYTNKYDFTLEVYRDTKYESIFVSKPHQFIAALFEKYSVAIYDAARLQVDAQHYGVLRLYHRPRRFRRWLVK